MCGNWVWKEVMETEFSLLFWGLQYFIFFSFPAIFLLTCCADVEHIENLWFRIFANSTIDGWKVPKYDNSDNMTPKQILVSNNRNVYWLERKCSGLWTQSEDHFHCVYIANIQELCDETINDKTVAKCAWEILAFFGWVSFKNHCRVSFLKNHRVKIQAVAAVSANESHPI